MTRQRPTRLDLVDKRIAMVDRHIRICNLLIYGLPIAAVVGILVVPWLFLRNLP